MEPCFPPLKLVPCHVKHRLAITAAEHFKFSEWTDRAWMKEERVCGCLDEVVCVCVCMSKKMNNKKKQ